MSTAYSSRYHHVPWALYFKNNDSNQPIVAFGARDNPQGDVDGYFFIINCVYDTREGCLAIDLSAIDESFIICSAYYNDLSSSPGFIHHNEKIVGRLPSNIDVCSLSTFKKIIEEIRTFVGITSQIQARVIQLQAVYVCMFIINRIIHVQMINRQQQLHDWNIMYPKLSLMQNYSSLYFLVRMRFSQLCNYTYLNHDPDFPRNGPFNTMHGFCGYLLNIQGHHTSHFILVDGKMNAMQNLDPNMEYSLAVGFQNPLSSALLPAFSSIVDHQGTQQTISNKRKSDSSSLLESKKDDVPYELIAIENVVETTKQEKINELGLICPVCFTFALNPPNLACGHLICLYCIKIHYNTSSQDDCPLCRDKVDQSLREKIKKIPSQPELGNTLINKAMKHQIENIKIHCPVKIESTKEEKNDSTMFDNFTSSSMQPKSEMPCSEQYTLGQDCHTFFEHKKICNNVTVLCKAEGCGFKTPRYRMLSHERVCQFIKEKCQHCRQVIAKYKMQEHLTKGKDRGTPCDNMVECQYGCLASSVALPDDSERPTKKQKMEKSTVSIINKTEENDHYVVCPNKPRHCHMCSTPVLRKDMLVHFSSEEFKDVHLAYSESTSINKTKIVELAPSNVLFHSRLLLGDVKNSIEKMGSCTQLLRDAIPFPQTATPEIYFCFKLFEESIKIELCVDRFRLSMRKKMQNRNSRFSARIHFLEATETKELIHDDSMNDVFKFFKTKCNCAYNISIDPNCLYPDVYTICIGNLPKSSPMNSLEKSKLYNKQFDALQCIVEIIQVL